MPTIIIGAGAARPDWSAGYRHAAVVHHDESERITVPFAFDGTKFYLSQVEGDCRYRCSLSHRLPLFQTSAGELGAQTNGIMDEVSDRMSRLTADVVSAIENGRTRAWPLPVDWRLQLVHCGY